jgi:uracil-DNA glycosylase family 4
MKKLEKLQVLANTWSNCTQCQLLCHDRQNVVFGYGQYEKTPIVDMNTGKTLGFGGQVLIVGEAPGVHEDEQGVPFVGKSGMLLNQYLANVSARPEVKAVIKDINDSSNPDRIQGLDYQLRQLLLQEFFFTNVVACRPPENRDPTPKEIAACKPRLMEIIYLVDPVVIIAVGSIAVQVLLNRKISITQDRGQVFDVTVKGRLSEFKYPMIATLHPSYLMRKNDFNQKGGDGAKTYKDFLKAMELVDHFNHLNFGLEPPLRE